MKRDVASALALVLAAALPAAAQDRMIEVGPAGLMTRSNRTDLDPIALTAGALKSAGTYKLKSGGYYHITVTSDGTQDEAIEAPELFRNIWINQVSIDEVELEPTGLASIGFGGEGEAEIAFVAITPGTYVMRIPGTIGDTQKATFVIE